MARLPHKSSKAAGTKSGGSVPDFPSLPARFASNPGGDEANALFQRWSALMKRRWDRQEHDTVRRVTVVEHELAGANGYLEAGWTMQVTAGGVVSGIQVFSSEDPESGEQISYVAFQADRFQINTATGGNKRIFSADADAIKLGDVLTVDLENNKLFIGVGNFENADTPFYVDDQGRLSLKDHFSFDGTTLVIAGTGAAGNFVSISDAGFQVGADPTEGLFLVNNNAGNPYVNFRYDGDVFGSWGVQATHSALQLSDDSGHTVIIDGRGGITIFGGPGLQCGGPAVFLDEVWLGTHSAIGAETLTGFTTLKDNTGVVRKFAIIS